jgi:hypothetical protein
VRHEVEDSLFALVPLRHVGHPQLLLPLGDAMPTVNQLIKHGRKKKRKRDKTPEA